MNDYTFLLKTTTIVSKPCKKRPQTEVYITNSISKSHAKDEQEMEVGYLQTAMIEKPSSNLLLRNSETIRPAPPVLPKPVYKRFASVQNQTTNAKDQACCSIHL